MVRDRLSIVMHHVSMLSQHNCILSQYNCMLSQHNCIASDRTSSVIGDTYNLSQSVVLSDGSSS